MFCTVKPAGFELYEALFAGVVLPPTVPDEVTILNVTDAGTETFELLIQHFRLILPAGGDIIKLIALQVILDPEQFISPTVIMFLFRA